MNLELPFDQVEPDELDAYLDRIDRELDTLFLEAVAESFQQRPVVEPHAAEAAA
jgi:hypothetical protein